MVERIEVEMLMITPTNLRRFHPDIRSHHPRDRQRHSEGSIGFASLPDGEDSGCSAGHKDVSTYQNSPPLGAKDSLSQPATGTRCEKRISQPAMRVM